MGQELTAKPQVCILLGVWGEKFINDFLQLSLLSLLAPGNLPALCQHYRTKFVFLTRSYDAVIFEQHPSFQTLKRYCDISFISINDLIVIGNYSTTLTLAYERAIRETGPEMLNTYFLFLTSDYIMADGSLTGLMRYMKQGYSGICAGNFQVLQDEIEPFLLEHIDPQTSTMIIPPRKLLEKSFEHLHPIAISSLIEGRTIHNYRANRFFVRDGHHTLAGRFYLLHMLCIKPETMDYKIGSSCDYSFISEMCPSGNVAIINDSDDYLVIEIQSKEHELNYIQWGPYNLKKLTHALSEWTTEKHRNNVKTTIYYHITDLTTDQKIALDQKLAAFINTISIGLEKHPPKPFRNHPYWVGAINAFNQHQTIITQTTNDCDYFDLSPLNYASPLKQWYYRLFGHPPTVHRWHYRWYSYHLMMRKLKQYFCDINPEKIIALYDSYQLPFMRYSSWLKHFCSVNEHYYSQNLLYSETILESLQSKQFDLCVLFVRVEDLYSAKKTFATVNRILSHKGKILLVIPNLKNMLPSFVYDIKKEFACRMNTLISSPYVINNIDVIHDNATFMGSFTIETINKRFDYNKKLKLLFYGLFGLSGSLLCVLKSFLISPRNNLKGHCTDLLITLTPENNMENLP